VSLDSDKLGQAHKRAYVGDDGQSSSAQDVKDVDNESESEEEEEHGREKSVESDNEEEDDGNIVKMAHLEAVPTHRSSRNNTTSKNPVATTPTRINKPCTMPMCDGIVIEKIRTRKTKNYKVTNWKKTPREEYII
jgi:cobalamin biosynthesis protein CobT